MIISVICEKTFGIIMVLADEIHLFKNIFKNAGKSICTVLRFSFARKTRYRVKIIIIKMLMCYTIIVFRIDEQI